MKKGRKKNKQKPWYPFKFYSMYKNYCLFNTKIYSINASILLELTMKIKTIR